MWLPSTVRGTVLRLLPRGVREERLARGRYTRSTEPAWPCHFSNLFIQHTGLVYPCCLKWDVPRMVIGHVDDPDIVAKIREFQKRCTCSTFHAKLAKASETDVFRGMNIEVSLACNGKCAFCCVCAPEWRGVYDHYERIEALINALGPKESLVQGGEVLIQKKTLQWLERVKKKHSDMQVSLATNANVELDVLDQVERIFARVNVSVVGGQSETYAAIMGLDIEKMRSVVTQLIARGKVRVQLKYMGFFLQNCG